MLKGMAAVRFLVLLPVPVLTKEAPLVVVQLADAHLVVMQLV